jgi:hypothetical protein
MRDRLLLALSLCALVGGCSSNKKQQVVLPKTPAQALSELRRAVGEDDTRRIYQLLDQTSRWSVMTIYRDLRSICHLVRQHYPRERQARELERCRDADQAPKPELYFGKLARTQRLLEPLRGAAGGQERLRRALVREGGAWTYSGLKTRLEEIKLKVSRDLQTVRESAEALGGGR